MSMLSRTCSMKHWPSDRRLNYILDLLDEAERVIFIKTPIYFLMSGDSVLSRIDVIFMPRL